VTLCLLLLTATADIGEVLIKHAALRRGKAGFAFIATTCIADWTKLANTLCIAHCISDERTATEAQTRVMGLQLMVDWLMGLHLMVETV
jgi:hypothetical protein